MKKDKKIVSMAELNSRAMEFDVMENERLAMRTRKIWFSVALLLMAGYVYGTVYFSFVAIPEFVFGWFGAK